MARKKKGCEYSKSDSFENLEVVQEMALNRRGKDDESNPDISTFLKAEELKGKLCGFYAEKDKVQPQVNKMGSVIINGEKLELNVGEKLEKQDD